MKEEETVSQLKKIFSVMIAAGLGMAISATSFSASELTEAMKERIKPVGDVCMEGSDCSAAPAAVANTGSAPRSGEEVYKTKCFTCHGSGAAGAPRLGNAADWGPRVAKGMDTLYASAIDGFKGMPAKGLCMDCSDAELNAAVDHMVENSK